MKIPHLDRRCHWLRPNRGSRRPETLIFIDVESNMVGIDDRRVEHSLRLGWAALAHYESESGLQVVEWYQIADAIDFWHWVAKIAVECGETYVVAHNIAYDARILRAFSILPGIGFTPNYAIMAHTCVFFTFETDGTKIHLLDNSNYWQLPLEDLGQEFGVAKSHVDFDTVTDDELSAYCKRDVEILVKVWEFWLSTLDKHDFGNFAVTAAGQSWNAYRHRFMGEKIGIHNRKDAIDLERASYRGGRCEVFKVGKFNSRPYYKLDCNGLYAFCMKSRLYPTKLVKVLKSRNPDQLGRVMKDYLCIADVIVETDKSYYPYRLNKQNCYPTGTFRAQLATPELRFALMEGHIRAIGQVAIYEPGDLFSGFIDTLTPLRQQHKAQGDTGRSLIFKLLRNSLYGKFAQKGYKQEVIGDAPLDKVGVVQWVNADTGERCEDWTFGGVVLRQYYTGESFDSFPAISAHVAAYGRTHMLALLDLAGWENVLYMDTDSLIVTESGFERLGLVIDNLRLGHLKIEMVSNHLEIQAKKTYILGDKRAAKGIKKDAKKVGQDTYQQWHFTTLNYGFKSGNLDNVLTYQVEKQMSNTVRVGTVSSSGVVKPPGLGMKLEQAWEIVQPEHRYNYTWWVDLDWLASLPSSSEAEIPRECFRPPFLYSPEDV